MTSCHVGPRAPFAETIHPSPIIDAHHRHEMKRNNDSTGRTMHLLLLAFYISCYSLSHLPMAIGFGVQSSHHSRRLLPQRKSAPSPSIDEEPSAIESSSATTIHQQDQSQKQEQQTQQREKLQVQKSRMIQGVTSTDGPLNEAVAKLVGQELSLEGANSLIELGAVWARMEVLTEEELLSQYDDDDDSFISSSRALYADLPGLRQRQRDEDEEEDLEDYIQRMEQQRFRRILSPTWIEKGTDLRIYPQPRRFPACYELTPKHLLYQDTTFIVVDKPPMLPTQPDASNYHECCPGCVQDILGRE